MGGTALKTGGAGCSDHDGGAVRTLMLASCTGDGDLPRSASGSPASSPLVSGVVVMIIGLLSLIQVGLTSIGGGLCRHERYLTFGAPKTYLLLVGVVWRLLFCLTVSVTLTCAWFPLVIAMAAGYGWRGLGMLPENNAPTNSALIVVPTPLCYGLGIEWGLLLPLMLVFSDRFAETIGDNHRHLDIPRAACPARCHMKRLKGGVLANGLNLVCSGAVFNTFPNSCFRPEQRRDPADRRCQPLRGFCGGADADRSRPVPGGKRFCAAAFPEPVLGGATLVMFGTIAASGVRIVSREPLNRRAIMRLSRCRWPLVWACPQQPLILQFAPDW